MKLFTFILLIMLSTCYAQADVYVVTDKDTDNVISISNENDCVVQADMKLNIIKNQNLSDITIVKAPKYYKLDGHKLVPNLEKISINESANLVEYEKNKEEQAIEKYRKNKAIDEMEASGTVFKYSHKIE